LSGHAATLADEAGIDELEVSLTHDEDVAAAVVVALCHTSATSAGEPGQPLRDRLLNGAF
jgi:hypothetical protein